MAQSMEDKKTPSSFQLKSSKNVRNTLARLFGLRYSGVIDSATCRDLVYISGKMLDYGKHLHELDLNRRIEQLESLLTGQGNTMIEPKELDSPYTTDLKKRLAEAEQSNSSNKLRLIEMEKELKILRSQVWTGVGDE
jgi:hypothetical protein